MCFSNVNFQTRFRSEKLITLATLKISSLAASISSCSVGADLDFFFRNSSLRFAFFRIVDGLAFFLVTETRESLHLESKVKEKVVPMVREN